jgi:hypothetical protein
MQKIAEIAQNPAQQIIPAFREISPMSLGVFRQLGARAGARLMAGRTMHSRMPWTGLGLYRYFWGAAGGSISIQKTISGYALFIRSPL